jgi:hypothetical protein
VTYRFGQLRWPDTPAAESAIVADVPPGEVCLRCEEPITPDDGGYGTPMVTATGVGFAWHHEECFIRQMVGSVAHINQRCSCFVANSHEEDPPGLSRRQAARAAMFAWNRLRVGGQ